MESNILLFIQNNLRNPVCDVIFTSITRLGDGGFIWIALTVLLLFFKKTRKIGVLCALSLIGSLLVNNMILKNVVARTRPYEVIEGLQILIKAPHDLSFPSGHTASSFAAGTVLFLMLPKKYGIPAIVLAFLIALSRLYIGVHFPTDVLGGMISGVVIACTVVYIYKKKVTNR